MIVNGTAVSASVDELISNFRSALVAVLPFAEKIGIAWSDEAQYDDWERLTSALFVSLVASPIAFDLTTQIDDFPLTPYDRDVENYDERSWIILDQNEAGRLAFVRFLSRNATFDTIELADVDSSHRKNVSRKLEESCFALARRKANGEVEIVRSIKTDS